MDKLSSAGVNAKKVINALGLTTVIGGVAAVVAALVTGQDVVLDLLQTVGISPSL